jgi:small-conductance mechanosensitive channel
MAISVPLRVGIVVSALVFAAPIVTGDVDGSLTRLGELLLIALMLAGVPLMANAVVGLLVIWQRRVRVGERAELGNRRGRVLGVDLWSVRMEEPTGAEVHVPHLLLLVSPMRVFPLVRRIAVEVTIGQDVASDRVLTCLQAAAGDGFDQVVVGVTRLESQRLTYRLTARASAPGAESTLLTRTREALAADSIAIVSAYVMDEPR